MAHARAQSGLAPPAQLDVETVIEDDRWRTGEAVNGADIETAVLAAARALAQARPQDFHTPAAATLVLSDDARIQILNRDFRHQDAATNVLSFPAAPGATEPGTPRYLGDVIIARQTVEREAHAHHIPLVHHTQHLAIHGLLHLLGYDHATDAGAAIMEAIETQVLAMLGVADPYAAHDDIKTAMKLSTP